MRLFTKQDRHELKRLQERVNQIEKKLYWVTRERRPGDFISAFDSGEGYRIPVEGERDRTFLGRRHPDSYHSLPTVINELIRASGLVTIPGKHKKIEKKIVKKTARKKK